MFYAFYVTFTRPTLFKFTKGRIRIEFQWFRVLKVNAKTQWSFAMTHRTMKTPNTKYKK